MLLSTRAYFDALHQENYLLFLEWPSFVAHHYNIQLSADGLVDLLIFEALNNDFCEADARKIAVLYALNESPLKPFKSKLEYALVSIVTSVLQCLLYQTTNKAHNYQVTAKKTANEVFALMGRNSSADQSIDELALSQKQNEFFAWVDSLPQSDLVTASKHIMPIVTLRYLADEYSTIMSQHELKFLRLKELKELNLDLEQRTLLLPEIQQKIASCVTTIRQLSPADFEEEYLKKMLINANGEYRILLTLVHDYEIAMTEDDKTSLSYDLLLSRLSVVKALNDYLNQQTQWTPEVQQRIASYVAKIREMSPVDFEEDYLQKIVPPSLTDRAWRVLTDLGMRFFHLVQPAQNDLTQNRSKVDTPKQPGL